MKTDATGRELRATDERTARDLIGEEPPREIDEAANPGFALEDACSEVQQAAGRMSVDMRNLKSWLDGADSPPNETDVEYIERSLKGIVEEAAPLVAAARKALSLVGPAKEAAKKARKR